MIYLQQQKTKQQGIVNFLHSNASIMTRPHEQRGVNAPDTLKINISLMNHYECYDARLSIVSKIEQQLNLVGSPVVG